MIKQVMKSPFSGGNAVLHCEPSTLTFRKEDFCYIHQFYECEDSQQRNWTRRTLHRSITNIVQNMGFHSLKK